MSAVVVGAVAAFAVALAVPARPEGPIVAGDPSTAARQELSVVRRWRWPCSLLGGIAALTFVGGTAGVVAGAVLGVVTFVLASRSEPARVVHARRRASRELPSLVLLLAAALRSGADPVRALPLVANALPGAASDRLRPALARLQVGVPPDIVWAGLASDPVLAPLGRTLARAVDSGAPVADAVERLADDMAEGSRAQVEDRARSVGVRAALPLGLCLLPAFLLVGIVPVVVGLLSTIAP